MNHDWPLVPRANFTSPFLAALDDKFWQQSFHDHTLVHPLALCVLAVMGVFVIALPRRYATLPLVVIACFVATAQRISILTLDFHFLRILCLLGWARVLMRGEAQGFTWKRMDKLMVWFGVTSTLIYVLQWRSGSALVYRLGWSVDTVGLYFLYRCLVQRWEDFDAVATTLFWIAIPLALAFTVERTTRRNLFAVFGGVPEITMVREGKLRCQGAYSHPILAGCWWAASLPWIATLWFRGGIGRAQALLGSALSITLVFFSASSTPILGVGMVFVGAGAYVVRGHMKRIRWGILFTLIALHMVMKKPVWHLLARIDIVGGSTGHHRYFLIDSAVNHFKSWALLGTRSTAHWGYFLSDVTNEYILHGVRGGFISMVLFILIVGYAYQGVGRMMRLYGHDPKLRARTWAVGVSLFAHSMMFIAVSYFGQIYVIWFLQLALIGSLAPSNPVSLTAKPLTAKAESKGRSKKDKDGRSQGTEKPGGSSQGESASARSRTPVPRPVRVAY
jgi:hypothetical protein